MNNETPMADRLIRATVAFVKDGQEVLAEVRYINGDATGVVLGRDEGRAYPLNTEAEIARFSRYIRTGEVPEDLNTDEAAQKHTSGRVGYEGAVAAIRENRAQSHSLWLLLSTETQRDGFALKPDPWEGPGEYQRVEFSDGRDVLVRLPFGSHLPMATGSAA